MKILVLGGYGLIGASILRRLVSDGHTVTGLGRSLEKGRKVSQLADWISADIAKHQTPESWQQIIAPFDIVVNAAGVLQSGLTDHVTDTQDKAICALISACETARVCQFIQISAPGAAETSDPEFYRSKARADTFLKASSLKHIIFRPGLAISPQAYGGTSLLRQLAAFPVVQPIVDADTLIQTVSVADIAEAVSLAISRDLPCGDFDLVAETPETLEKLVLDIRNWLGFAHPVTVIRLPSSLGKVTAFFADCAGWLGWRSALRSTALKVLKKNVTGDASRWTQTTGQSFKSFHHTLAELPSTAQERIYARALLVFPLLLMTLSLFWIVSGVIGFLSFEDALQVMEGRLPDPLRTILVAGGGILDILIGIALLIRPWTRKAAFASILLAMSYLISSAVITPHLWADPLGPMIKVFPAIALALAVAAITEDR